MKLPPGRPRLIQHEAEPENSEFPMAYLSGWLTPVKLLYRRNHLPYPVADLDNWHVAVSGHVDRPRSLSLNELRGMKRSVLWATLECSGNKRANFTPPAKGTPWGDGAIGNLEWTGVPLAEVLRLVGVRPGAVEVLFTGADEGFYKDAGRRLRFARSLPLARAMDPEVLLAFDANGEPLTHEHGAPLRLVVPHWYAMASVKWVTQIEVLSAPFRGYFQSKEYVYLPQPGAYNRAVPVTTQRVNATVTYPREGMKLSPGVLVVRGAAWGDAVRLEVSLDGGETWADAEFTGPVQPASWRLWQYKTPALRPGAYRIMARATDQAGQTQPLKTAWNALGYGNHDMPVVNVTIGR